MTHRNLLALTAAALMTAPLGALAQSQALTGEIAERFGNSVVVDTGERRVLVELPDASGPAFAPGAQITVTGDLDGDTLRDARLRPTEPAAPGTPPAPAAPGTANAPGTPPAPPAPGRPPALAAAEVIVLPAPLDALDLREVRDSRDDGEREIRALLPDNLRFEADYDRGDRLEELKTEPRGALPQPLLDAVLSAPVRDALRGLAFDRIHEVEFDDDGRIEVKGHIAETPAEAELSAAGDLLDFERKSPRAVAEQAFDLPRPEIDRLVTAAGYTAIERVETRGRHADVWAVNPEGEPVRLRVEGNGKITREERR